jgi:hypothetical protein
MSERTLIERVTLLEQRDAIRMQFLPRQLELAEKARQAEQRRLEALRHFAGVMSQLRQGTATEGQQRHATQVLLAAYEDAMGITWELTREADEMVAALKATWETAERL